MHDPLPLAWLDRIFGRLALRYADQWLRMWEGFDMLAVRADWAEELAGLHAPDRQHALKFGLENLPIDWPPNAAQFRAICNRAPEYVRPALPAPAASPEGVRRAREAIASITLGAGRNPRAWALRLRDRHLSGDRLTDAQVAAYQAVVPMIERETAP